MISESIEDRTYRTLDSIEEQFLNQNDYNYNEEKSEIEIEGFLKDFNENQITYTEKEKKELLEKFAGCIVYGVKTNILKKTFYTVTLRKMYHFLKKKNWLESEIERLPK